MTTQTVKHDYSAIGVSGQIPLCMIGDSITWAEFGDHWRKELLKHLPNLAFIGSHTACFGYSHAGEGGNNTGQVLARLGDIPGCPYYSLLIGTNNNSVNANEKILHQAEKTAEDIIKIVERLITEKRAEKVFLSSLLPCYTDNPLRDICNHETNKILREKFSEVFPPGKVIWVEYEEPIRKIPGWEEIILLHPKPEGYAVIAGITARAISKVLNIEAGQMSAKPDNTGVRVVNLMGPENVTACPVIAGWYILSFSVDRISGKNSEVKLLGRETPFELNLPVPPGKKRLCKCFYTEAEGYGYTRDYLLVESRNCEISEVLLEKMRPSGKASVYRQGSYIDAVSPCSNGELLEYN